MNFATDVRLRSRCILVSSFIEEALGQLSITVSDLGAGASMGLTTYTTNFQTQGLPFTRPELTVSPYKMRAGESVHLVHVKIMELCAGEKMWKRLLRHR